VIGIIGILLFLLILILIGTFLVRIIPYILIGAVVYVIYKLLKKNNNSYRPQKKVAKIDWRRISIWGIAIIYLIIPVDFIPDFLFIVGFLDDLLGLGIAYYLAEKRG